MGCFFKKIDVNKRVYFCIGIDGYRGQAAVRRSRGMMDQISTAPNAANNILATGHAVLAGGAEPLGLVMKPEPLVA